MENQRNNQLSISGSAIAGGVAVGRAHLDVPLLSRRAATEIAAENSDQEVERLESAVAKVKQHLEDYILSRHLATDEDLQRIVAAHLMILDDKHFFQSVSDSIRNGLVSAEVAVERAFQEAVSHLAGSRDRYLRARVEDLRDICMTLQEALLRGEQEFRPFLTYQQDTVFVSAHLHPSSILQAQRAGAVAFISSSDALASHGVILLRASGIPSIAALDLPAELIEGSQILVNATTGVVTIEPTEETVEAANNTQASVVIGPVNAAQNATTQDGKVVELWANIDNPEQIGECLDNGLHGIGLFRTELMAVVEGATQNQQQQQEVYRDVAQRLGGRPIVYRTFDLGGDKVISSLQDGTGANPALGVRGLRRHLLRYPEELRTQLRAILAATVGFDAAVLFPMVTHDGDVRAARMHLEAARQQLADAHVEYNAELKIGAMVEVPAAALNVAQILASVDFVSVGTNDLNQYLSAADRSNADVGSYLTPSSSGIYTLLETVFAQVKRMNRPNDVYICGELASSPEAVTRLVQLGARRLVVIPQAAQRVRQAIGAIKSTAAEP